ncbi:hypothetical protein [Streptomyces lavendulae]|uniref:hypothetical protein n=1 Tax=Streptomyces lavendulae TaxID=1914 RepID=UPI0024A2B2AB|nr:hypothetical protein [Streptomyces lavendulae]GLX17500.1 hypothetical protein Slala01_11440 [Streptomyces lavendulae subsp. lavendulae]GLX24639.1 hypothetical protein Slala02_04590 [Streptomyces lavendulae subsp. lavendulae]
MTTPPPSSLPRPEPAPQPAPAPVQPPPVPAPAPAPAPPDTEPLVSLRTALVLLTAAFVATVVGALTARSTRDAAGGLIAALSAFGAATLALHKLIGR